MIKKDQYLTLKEKNHRKYNICQLDYTYNKTYNCIEESDRITTEVDKTTTIVVDFNISQSESNKLHQKLVRIRRVTK